MNYNDFVEKWQSYNILTTDDLDKYLDNFRIMFAFNSNHIENPNTTYADTREIFENNSVSSFTGDLRTIFEISNQKTCYEFLKDKIISKEPITQDFIKQVHYLLMYGCYDQKRYNAGEKPGEYKKHLYVVGDDVGAEPEEVADELEYIIQEVSENEGKNPLTIAAYLHLSLEAIHPFADGNSRLGRTLMNYYLITHNYPPTIIYSEDKNDYYIALAIFDKTGQLDGFVKFIQEQTIKTWQHSSIKRFSLSKATEFKFFEVTQEFAKLIKNSNIPFEHVITDKNTVILKVERKYEEQVNLLIDTCENKPTKNM